MALAKTTAELKPFFPARFTFDVDDLLPVMNQVERVYLKEQILGTLYDDLLTAYDADTMSAEEEALREACLPAVVNLAIHDFTGMANVEMSSGGLVVGSNADRKPAAEWRTRDFERAVLRAGTRGLDGLLNFLRHNVADYPTWESSPQAALLKSIVPSTRIFNTYVEIGNSGWLFWRMMATRDRIEEEQLRATICSDTLYNLLRAESHDEDNWTGENAQLIKLARPALCHLTIGASILELALTKDERGIYTQEAMLGGQVSLGPKGANDARLDALIRYHNDQGKKYLNKLSAKLLELAKAGDLATYAASDCYTAQVAEETTPTPTIDPDSAVGNLL